MSKKVLKPIQKTFVRQQDQQDCGVACLLSVIRFYGGNASLERLRELSGTHSQGTTMLGLVQACPILGLEAKGLQTDVNFLKNTQKPLILHVLIDKKLPHYVVCYGFDAQEQKFCIGDPAKGIIFLSETELLEIWQSKALISIKKTENFIPQKTQEKEKIKYFLSILREDYPVLAVSAILGVVLSVLGLAMAIFSQKLIDEILPEKNIKKLIAGIILFALLLLIKAFLGYLRGFFLNKQSQNFNNRLVGSFLDKLMFLPFGFFQNRKTGDLIARLNDTRRIQQNISFLSNSLVIDVLTLLISSFFVFHYHWLIGLATLISIPLYVWLSWTFSQKILVAQRQVMEASARNESNYIDVIQGIETIKSFQKEDFFLENTKGLYGFFQAAIFRLGLIGLRFGLLAEFLGIVLMIGIISLACYLIVADTLKVGELMAVLSVVSSIVPAVIRISTANILLQEAKIAFDRMYEFASLPQEKKVFSEHTLSENIQSLSVENLSFRFAGRKSLFQNLSFSVQKGEILGIIGENGTGKSTLFKIIQKFYEQEQGTVYLNRLSTKEIDSQLLRSKLAVVPQEVKIFSGTLLENICLDNSQYHFEKVVLFCKKWGFEQYFLRLPQGYFTILGEQGVHLSGGQKQILALARALYKKPEILLLDEFNTAMDWEVAHFSLELLESLKSEMIILSVSHKDIPKLSSEKYVKIT